MRASPSFKAVALRTAVVLALFGLYVLSGPRSLPEADSGELAAVAVRGGIVHPPGYPLHMLFLQLFARLAPLLGVTPALSLFSSMCVCAAALLLLDTLRKRGCPPLEAALATVVVFASTNVWRAATSFEPFALNLLLAAALIHVCARMTGADGGSTRPMMLGLLFGLGLCNHHSLVMFSPLALAVLPSRRLGHCALGFALGALGLLLFLPMRAQPGFVWGDWSAFLPRLATHVLRREYGTFSLAPSADQGSLLYGPARMLGTLPAVLSYVFCLPLALGLALQVKAARGSVSRYERRFSFGCLASLCTSGLLFPALFRLRGTALDAMIADRFLALPMLLLVMPLASGLGALGVRMRSVGVVLALAHIVWVWPHAQRAGHQFYEDHLRNIFEILEPGSTLIVVADGGYAGGLYGQYVWGRVDVQLVVSGLAHPWYVKRLEQTMAAGGRPRGALYLLDVPSTQRSRQPRVYPIGPLLRVAEGETPLPSARAVFELNQQLFARLRLPSVAGRHALDAWEAEELTNYARAWELIGLRLQREGETALAAEARRFQGVFDASVH